MCVFCSKCVKTLLGHEEPVRTVLNLGGGVLATGSLDHTTIIWGADTQEESDEKGEESDKNDDTAKVDAGVKDAVGKD